MGRLVFFNSTLSQAAREGARLASVEASWMGSTDPSCNTVGGPVCPANVTTLRTHVKDAVNRMIAPFGPIPTSDVFLDCAIATGPTPSGNWTTQTCSSPNSGSLVSVRVIATFTPITPVIGQIIGTRSLSGAATMVSN